MFSFLRVSPQTLLQLKLNLMSLLVPYEYEVFSLLSVIEERE